MKQLLSTSMKLVRCKCGDEHGCTARLSNRERAVKAAGSRAAAVAKPGVAATSEGAEKSERGGRENAASARAVGGPLAETPGGSGTRKSDSPAKSPRQAGSSPAPPTMCGECGEVGRHLLLCRLRPSENPGVAPVVKAGRPRAGRGVSVRAKGGVDVEKERTMREYLGRGK